MTKAVVLHSGGLDSTTLLEVAIQDGNDEVLSLGIMYGSLHNEAEAAAALDVMEWYKQTDQMHYVRREVVEIPPSIFQGEASALMGEIPMPSLTYKEITESEGPSPTVVPFRNANLISAAVAIAEARGYDYVYIGAHGEDAHNWAYPDCTPEFLGAMASAVYIGTYQKVQLRFPFIWMTKSDIVVRAAELGAPIEFSWSCYNPVWVDARIAENDIQEGHYEHCGHCPTCIERAQAFAQAGFADPTTYMVDLEVILGEDFNIDSLQDWE